MTAFKKEKNLSVETLRGAAIILVVIGHVIGSASDGGMKVADDSFLRYFYYTFEYLRMPLFTVISGWVYALYPARVDTFFGFTAKKIRRILLPALFVGCAYFLLQYIVPGTNKKGDLTEMWRLLVFPYTLFWYLPSLFLVFIFVAIIDSLKKMESFVNWLIIFCFAIGLLFIRDIFIPEESQNFFSYKGAIYLLPFFIIGVGIKRFNEFFTNKFLFVSLIVILGLSLCIQQLSWYKIIDYNFNRSGGFGLLIGISGTILLFRLRWNIKWLIWFGSFAYSIFLFHAFGTAAGRIIIKKLGIDAEPIIFAISLLVGMGLPIIAEKVLDRFGITRMLFLGRSYRKNR